MSESHDEPVVVAGAGPTGMTAALALEARGVPAVVLEAESEDRERPGSRAIYVHGSTLHTLERNHDGLGKRLADAGLVWPTRRTLWRGKEVFSRTYSTPGGSGDLPHFTSLPQVDTEDFLLETLEEVGVDVHWDSTVETVESSADGVRVVTEDGEEWESPYVVGADGAGSTVRKEIGSEFDGSQSENSFIIADVDEDPENPRDHERVFHYDHPDLDGRNVLLVPFTGGWRVDIQCKVTDDPERLASDEAVSDMVATTLGERYRDRVAWVSSYQFKQVTADTFVDEHRRVLLAGEAGHLFAPFGARGMNSGIADADEAASAIAVASRARSRGVARAEVELYASRRETAAEYNKNAAGEALEYLQGDGVVTKFKKRAAAGLSDYWEDAGEWLDDAPYGPRGGPPIANVGRY
ncbi:FAD-dependent monooxygenase [Halorarum salinum]|uniref:FAD-dependent monooxygenase n=1 Tax=Halorarum salinum TaxID=2743089 RepID=A0A7D5QEJ9_9EURY|nr:FAD-dependent monooxygenase [Halobaculum salinum]QLG64160.1 FAD-dependent monooxygenase [Halobaculum salinum]